MEATRICSVDDCDRPSKSRGWCGTHYERWRRTGSADDPISRPTATCSIDACTDPVLSRGWCSKHYRRWKTHGTAQHEPPAATLGCQVEGCDGGHLALGYCSKHYRRHSRYGDVSVNLAPKDEPVVSRFMRHVQVTDGCWLWTGSLNHAGYGQTSVGGVSWRAHRLAWALAGRPLLDGMELDHLCGVRRCVRVDHLDQVTKQENIRRRDATAS